MDTTARRTAPIASPQPSLEKIKAAIAVLFEPAGQVVELRIVKGGRDGTISGYYDDHAKLAADTYRLAQNASFESVYWSAQVLDPALLARSANTYQTRVRTTTSDTEVVAYRWLTIDCDPIRIAGVSSTDEEKRKARAVAERIRDYFIKLGFTSILADSGNGFHVLLRIDLPASDALLVKRVIESLASGFDTDEVKVDPTVANPARIWKAYGTCSRKGSSTADRPHRQAELLNVPAQLILVPREELEKIAGPEVKKDTRQESRATERAEWMEAFLAAGGIEHRGREEYKDGWRWKLAACPFDSTHPAEAAVFVMGSGAMGFTTLHNDCPKKWPEFRALVEAAALEKVDAWLNDPTAQVPSLDDAVASLALCNPLEVDRRRKRLAERLGTSLSALKRAIGEKQESLPSKREPVRLSHNTGAALRESLAQLLLTTKEERAALGLPQAQEAADRVAEQLLWDYVKQQGQIFTTDSGQGYILLHDRKEQPIPVSHDGHELNGFLTSLGIHAGARARDRLGEHLGTMCWQEAPRVEPRISFHYDPEAAVAYFAEQAGQLIRVSADIIERVPNGQPTLPLSP
jgi:hypothetical protein